MGILLVWPLVVIFSAMSALTWLIRYPFPALMDERDRKRVRGFFGLLDPALRKEFVRWLKRPWSLHDLVNMGSEWARSDAQRAFKVQSLFSVTWFTLLLVALRFLKG